MVFDVFTKISIDNKEYKLCLKNRLAFMAESELMNKNLLITIKEPPMSMSDLFVLFKYAFIGGGQKGDEDAVFDLFTDAIAEHGYNDVYAVILETVVKSGLLGDAKKMQATAKV